MKLHGGYLAAMVLTLAIGSASGIQIATNQFAGTASIITFETGSTALPGIPGLSFSGGDATFSSYGFGSQIFGNLNGSTYLDVYFTQPQQAVGAYIINDSPFGGVTGVIEVAYDQNNNVLESVSTNFPALGAPRRFLGIGEPTAQIYRVEWQYIGGGYFGVDNVIYGDAIGLSQMPNIPTGLSSTLQGTAVALSWSAADRASSYNVKRASTSSGPFANVVTGVSTTNYTDNTVTNGGVYFYVVTAMNSFGESAVSHQTIAFIVDHFTIAAIASPQTSSVPFAVTVTARATNGTVLTNFIGAAMFSAGGDHGAAPLTPVGTPAFVNGQWTGNVTIASYAPDSHMLLFAKSNGVAGASNPFNVVAPPIQLFNLTAADLAYDPFAQRIYATVPAGASTYSNSLVVIDPVLGRVETAYYLGSDPTKMALSSDGQFLYIGFNGTNVFRRFNLTSRAVDVEGYLGFDDYYTWLAYNVIHLTTLPGSPHSVVVVKLAYGYDTQVQIFDDAVARPNLLGGVIADHQGTAAALSATRLYAGAPFSRLNLDASGVASYDTPSSPLGLNDDMKFQGDLLFTASGKVFNPETLAVQGTLTNCSILEPDVAAGRIFALGSHSVFAQPDAWNLYAWNSTNLQLAATLSLPGVLGSPLSLVRWGRDGLAFCTSQNQLYLLRTAFVLSVPPIMKGGSRPSPSSFQLSFTGDPFCPHTIWASTNLMNWTLLGAAAPMTNGWFGFVDTNTPNWPRRFYRAAAPQ